ncbi:MAG: DUF1415 domain-containing protein [Betaproteobacteria bacterium]
MSVQFAAPNVLDPHWRDAVLGSTTAWLEHAVIGLNLCPFARAVHAAKRIRLTVTDATTPERLVEVLHTELELLGAADPATLETTLLIHPCVLGDFLDYNDFLDVADAVVEEMELDGIIQVASFHPRYQFDGTGPDDIDNFSNRSPYPTLHLLREESVERAVAAFGDTSRIFQANIETLRRLGREGWDQLGPDSSAPRRESDC